MEHVVQQTFSLFVADAYGTDDIQVISIYIHIMQIFLSCLKLRAAPFILDKKLLNKEICSWPWSGSGATFFDVAALVAF